MFLNKASYYVLVFAIGLLLLVLPQTNIVDYVQSTITSKFIVFAYSCLAISGSFIAMFLVSKQKTIQLSKLDIILLLLVGYVTINRYLIQPEYSFSIRYMELIGLSLLYIILRILPIKIFAWLLLAIVISGIIQAIYGNLQLLGYYPSNHSGFKLTGSFFNPGPYAGFLVTVWSIALGMHLFKEMLIGQVQTQINSSSKLVNTILRYVFEYIPLLCVISIILVIPATQSRGAWLAVLLSSFVLLEVRYHFIKHILKKLTQTKRTALIVVVCCIIFAGLFGVYHFKKGSADGRLFIWKTTTDIIKDFPLNGVGFDRFKAHYMNYQANYFVKHGETSEALVADNTYYAFNEWLQFVAENGLLGLLFLALALYVIFKLKVVEEKKYLHCILIATLLNLGVFAVFSYPMQILPIKLIIIVALALLVNLDNSKYLIVDKNKRVFTPYINRFLKTTVFLVSVFGVLKGFIYVKTLNKGFVTWKNALEIYKYADYEGAINEYERAYSTLKKEGDFLMNYGKALAMEKQNKKAIQILGEAKQYLNTTIIETALGDAYKEMKKYDKAEIAYKNAANMIPIRFYPLYLQAKLYNESGQNDKAVSMAKVILKKEIKVPSTAIKEIKAETKRILKENSPGVK